MDADFWAARLAAAKRQYAFQNHHHLNSHLDRLNMDDFEVEEEVRPDFPCPYCYEEYDIVSLCSHLEDEHSSESRVTICPICSVKVARDMLSHLTLQHGQLFKISFLPFLPSSSQSPNLPFPLTDSYLHRRRRLRRVAIPNSQALSLLGRDLREAHLQVLLGSSGTRSSTSNASTDPLLSSLILNYPSTEAVEISKSVTTNSDDSTTKNDTPLQLWKSSLDPSLSHEEKEKRMKQAAGRANFVQDILLSTLLGD